MFEIESGRICKFSTEKQQVMALKNKFQISVVKLSMLLMVLVWSQSGFAGLCNESDLPVADKMYFNTFVKLDLPPTIESLAVEACPDGFYYTGLWRYITAPTEAEPDPRVVLSCYRDAYKSCPDGGDGHCDPSATIACAACDGSANSLKNIKPIPIPYCYGKRVKHICKMNSSDPWYHCKRGYFASVPPEQCPREGNPCVPSTGNKIESETDYVSTKSELRVIRYYRSQGITDNLSNLGHRWQHNYSQRIDGNWDWREIYNERIISPIYDTPRTACLSGWNALKGVAYRGTSSTATARYNNGLCEITKDGNIIAKLVVHNTLDIRKDYSSPVPVRQLSSPGGRNITFFKMGGHWVNVDQGIDTLQESGTDFLIQRHDGSTITFNQYGIPSSIEYVNGSRLTFTFGNEGELRQVVDQHGGRLDYIYNNDGLISIINTPDGTLSYQYDPEGRLISVTYPDSRKRQYHYEDSRLPNHLTGITDENGDRYATWAYDTEGRAILSEHAGNVERVEFAYNPDGTTTVTDAAGAERIYHFTVKQGQMKVDHIEGNRCTTCSGGSIQAYTYDSNGFIASKTDWNGNITTYTRDAQGRELSRTEASGTPQERVITTSWDTTINKPLTVTEPDKITEFTYNVAGKLVSRQQRAVQ
ncbi:MAG: DUF6531 domain-containing protein [Candidatus Thiodiazotropha taylori]